VSPVDDISRFDNYNYNDGEVDKQLGIDWKHRDQSIILINSNNEGLNLNTFNNQQDKMNKSSTRNLNGKNV